MSFTRKKGKPPWLKRKLPTGSEYEQVRKLLSKSRLNTVCQEANCPNIWECFSNKTATFMILGSQCTRNCKFCNITTGTCLLPPDPDEPQRVAKAARELGLKYVVVTSVTRDDLEDGGAGYFAETIFEIKNLMPQGTKVEVLIPDFKGDKKALQSVIDAKPDVLNHNIETVPSIYAKARPEANYHQSLELLQRAFLGFSPVKSFSVQSNSVKSGFAKSRAVPVKSGIMVGLGEEMDELKETIKDLFNHGCRILTIGQYLQPSKLHLPVAKYYTPEEFDSLKLFAKSTGFTAIASGPFVRSSYQADKLYPGI